MNLRLRGLVVWIPAVVYSFFVLFFSFFIRSKKEVIVFGGFAMIKYARWAAALNEIGIASVTLVPSVQAINSREDWDLTWLDTCPKWIRGRWFRRFAAPAFSWFWVLRNARVTCTPVGGISFFTWAGLDKFELWFLRKRGIKTVAICGGGDAYALGNIDDPSLRHALQSSYPDRARIHRQIERKLRTWEERADVFIADKMILDGIARSDLISPHIGIVDIDYLESIRNTQLINYRGDLTPLRIIHAPNHRIFKGTEFVVEVVAQLQQEGHNIELLVVEGVQNNKLLELVANSDVVIDQLIMPGYANFAIEAIALGKPVICNLEPGAFTTLMNRYSFMADCPMLSASPETLGAVLRNVILDRDFRIEIGIKGTAFATKYHSYSAWQALWTAFERNNFNGNALVKENFFHPLHHRIHSAQSGMQ